VHFTFNYVLKKNLPAGRRRASTVSLTVRLVGYVMLGAILTGLHCPDESMGKVWKRTGPSEENSIRKAPPSQSQAQPQQNLRGRTNVWTRRTSESHLGSNGFDLKGTAGPLNDGKQILDYQDCSNSPAAKRRRLAAQGRLPQQESIQNKSASRRNEQIEPANGLRALGESQDPSEYDKRKASEDAAGEEAHRKQAEALRRQNAEEEARISAAKVRSCPETAVE